MADLLPKMTVKAVGVDPKKVAAVEAGKLLLCRIIGIATGIKIKEDARTGAVFESILGTFKAQHAETKAEYTSSVLYLPGGIHESVTEALKSAGDAGAVRFALDVYAVKATNAVGYSYAATPLIEGESDPLADMQKALPALGGPPSEPVKLPPAPEKPAKDGAKK